MCFGTVYAQTHTFSINLAGLKIGDLQASHIRHNAFDYYVTNSAVEFLLFVNIKMYVKTESLYENGMLLRSTVSSSINGKLYHSKTQWNKDHYVIDCSTYKYTYKDTTLTKPITWSASKLYFEKPPIGTEVYTESYGKLGSMKELPDKSMKMVSPKSKQIYVYSETSRLLKLEVVNSIKNFEIISTDTIH